MKKLLSCVSAVALIFSLTACDPSSSKLEYSDLTADVISVELVNYENPEQQSFSSWVPDQSSKLVPLDMENLTVLEDLDDSKTADFLKKLSKADILDKYYAFNSPKGICIKLSHQDGSFTLITCDYENESFRGYIGKYGSGGEIVSFIGSFSSYDSFELLVNDYFETSL